MAYFGSNYYEAEPGVYLPIPYGGSYDSVSRHHALTSYSCYESYADPFVGAYDPTMSRLVISYFVSIDSWSKLFVYGPFHSQITISYISQGTTSQILKNMILRVMVEVDIHMSYSLR